MKVCPTCGFQAAHRGASAAQADYWFRRHSCAKHLTAAASKTRGDARRGSVDRTPQPCLHKHADHQHGTRACYVLDRCRCEPCAAANAAAEKHRVRQQAYGRYDKLTDADPVHAHVDRLTAAGMGLKQVAKVSGVAHGALWKLMYGKTQRDGTRKPSARVLTTTANKLYALDPTEPLPLADHTVLTLEASRMTHRKLQALVALGWPMTVLGTKLGMDHPANVIPIIRGDRPALAATARAVSRLFDELCMTPPPETDQRTRISASRARRFAEARGWVPPLALDDLDDEVLEVDGPGIDEVVVLRRLDGDRSVRITHAEGREIANRWRATGRSDAEMERVTGLNPSRYPAEERAS